MRKLVLIIPLLGAACADEVKTYPAMSMVQGRLSINDEVKKQISSVDPKTDQDGDTMVDADELAGWSIRVDETGTETGITPRRVTSNPKVADSDSDGLDDGEEKRALCDPNSDDTDGDGLSDFDEVMRWGTSPTSVDTDHDARGRVPNPSAAPDPLLYDGAELDLVEDPAAPGGIALVPGPNATSPLHGDSDGDGVWDYDETKTPIRSALIAEVPTLTVEMSANSEVGLYLDMVTTDGSATTSQSGSSAAFGGGIEFSQRSSATLSIGVFSHLQVSGEASAGVGLGLGQNAAGSDISEEVRAGVGARRSLATQTSVSSQLNTHFKQAWNEAETEARTEELRITGGRITLAVTVKNTGLVACKLRNLSFVLWTVDARTARLVPLAQLVPATPADEYVLGIDESIAVMLEARDVQAERVVALMQDLRELVIAPANYDTFTAGDDNYDFIAEDVDDRTSTVTLDFGDKTEIFRVGTAIGRDVDGAPTGLTVAQIFDFVGVDYDATPVTGAPPDSTQPFIFSLEDTVTELYASAAPELGDPAPYPPGLDPGPRLVKRGWFAVIERAGGGIAFDADFFRAHLFPGDHAAIVLLEDADRDGLASLEESLVGTSDEAIDSDGDGLSDWLEQKVGWDVAVAGQTVRRAYPDAKRTDLDGDGLADAAELAAGTDPRDADTDHDGLGDAEEVADANDDRLPLRFEDTTGPAVSCSRRGGRMIIWSDGPPEIRSRDAMVQTLVMSDPNGVVEASIVFHPAESEPTVIRPSPADGVPTEWTLRLSDDRFVSEVTVRDGLGNQTVFGYPNMYDGACQVVGD